MNKQKFRKDRFTFATFTGMLCILIAFAACLSFFANEPFWMVSDMVQARQDIKETQETLDEKNARLEEAQAQYDTIYDQNKAELDKLEAALTKANTDLNKVCDEDSYDPGSGYQGYFSYYYFEGPCDNNGCESLHQAVTTAENNLKNFKTKIKLTTYENKIANLENTIPNIEEKLADLQDDLKELTTALIQAIYTVVALLICAVALFFLGIYISMQKRGKLTLISIVALTLGSILFLLRTTIIFPLIAGEKIKVAVLDFLINPYLWSIVIMAMFAVILVKKQGKLIKFRVIAIIAAIIDTIIIWATLSVRISEDFLQNIIIFLVFAITMILVSFVLVPIDFKEYIPIAKHIFLTMITLGIWTLVWIYNVTKNLNETSTEYRKPVKELLLYMFLPPYNIYWMFKTAECVEEYGAANDKSFKISTICLVFALAFPLLSTILIQDKINMIVGKPQNIENLTSADELLESAVEL